MLNKSYISKSLFTTALVIMIFWSSLFFSWLVLSSVNFAYPWLYSALSIDETISIYGPQNRYKDDFHITSDEERFRLFGEIVIAIHQSGEGLHKIQYYHPQGYVLDNFLRTPEIVHLQDVAKLLDRLYLFSILLVLTSIILLFFGCSSRFIVDFSAKKNILISMVCVVILTSIVLLVGAEEIFYQWHTLVFPDDHQWFFYYQDSLMSTLMQAPNLFGAIAALLAIFSLIIFSIFLRLTEILLAQPLKNELPQK